MSDDLTTDDLTRIGVDGIRRSLDDHYDTMMEIERDTFGAYLAIQNQAARIEELEAKLAWQPIETAPSEHLLFYGDTRLDVGVIFSGWKAQNGRCYADNGDLVKPTHWMHLPAPPSQN